MKNNFKEYISETLKTSSNIKKVFEDATIKSTTLTVNPPSGSKYTFIGIGNISELASLSDQGITTIVFNGGVVFNESIDYENGNKYIIKNLNIITPYFQNDSNYLKLNNVHVGAEKVVVNGTLTCNNETKISCGKLVINNNTLFSQYYYPACTNCDLSSNGISCDILLLKSTHKDNYKYIEDALNKYNDKFFNMLLSGTHFNSWAIVGGFVFERNHTKLPVEILKNIYTVRTWNVLLGDDSVIKVYRLVNPTTNEELFA